jgi:hypothetical protein
LKTKLQSPEAAGGPTIAIDLARRDSEPETRRVIVEDYGEMRNVRTRRKEGKEGPKERPRRKNIDTQGIILSGGWRRKETYAGNMLPIHLS